jgi:hypothetical protein
MSFVDVFLPSFDIRVILALLNEFAGIPSLCILWNNWRIIYFFKGLVEFSSESIQT